MGNQFLLPQFDRYTKMYLKTADLYFQKLVLSEIEHKIWKFVMKIQSSEVSEAGRLREDMTVKVTQILTNRCAAYTLYSYEEQGRRQEVVSI